MTERTRPPEEPKLVFKDSHTRGKPFSVDCETDGTSLFEAPYDNEFTRNLAIVRMQQHAQTEGQHYFHVKNRD